MSQVENPDCLGCGDLTAILAGKTGLVHLGHGPVRTVGELINSLRVNLFGKDGRVHTRLVLPDCGEIVTGHQVVEAIDGPGNN